MANEQRTLTANFTANSSGFAAGTNEAIQKLRELNTQVTENKAKIRETNAEMRTYQRELDRLKAATNNGANATEQERARMRELQDAIAQCRANLGTLATAQQRLQSEVRNVNRELDEQRNAAQNVSEAALSLGDVLKANLASEAIKSGISAITNGLKQAATYCYGVGTSFEAGMSQVEAISGASGESLEALTEKAKELGSSTKFTATEAASAMNYMAMAGWDAEQMLAGIDGVIGLAAASGGDLAETSDIITDALTAFGMKAEDVGHFADVLAAASANANTNVSMLGESFKYVAPLAGTMGYSIDETAEALGIMANSGIKASTAGTSMRTMLTNLSQGVTISAAAFGEMDISAANADGSMKSLNEVLGELREAFALMTEEEKTNNAATIAGDRALSGFLSLVNAGEADINKLRGAIEECDGAAANMAETMQQNVAGKATILKSAIEGLGIAVYDKFSGAIGDTLGNITEKIDDLSGNVENGALGRSLEGLAESLGDAAEEFVDFAGEVLPGFIGALTNVMKFLTDFRTEIQAVLSAYLAYKAAMKVTTFITSVVDGVKGLVAAFKDLRTATDAATAAQNANNAAVKSSPIGLIATAIAVVVGSIIEFTGRIETATECVERLNEETKNYINSAKESREAAEHIRDLADEYRNLKNSADDTEDVKNRLQEIQDELLERYGTEANKLDLVNGKYEEQKELLEGIAKIKDEASERDITAAYNTAMETDSKENRVQVIYGDSDIPQLRDEKFWDIIKASPYIGINDEGAYRGLEFYGGVKQKRNAYAAILEAYEKTGYHVEEESREMYNKFVDEFNRYDQLYKDYQAAIDAYNNLGKVDMKGGLSASAGYAEDVGRANEERWAESRERQKRREEAAKKSAEERAEEYKNAKQLADDLFKVKEISEQEYYDRLKELRDTYLDENTHEWYVATAEIMSLADKSAKSLGDAADETAKRVKGAFTDIKDEFQKLLDGIDAELEKHNRDKEDEEYQSKIDSLTKRLQYEKLDIYTRKSLEKELADLNEEHDEVLYKRGIDDRKEIIRDASAAAGAVASAGDITKMTQQQWNAITAGMSAAVQSAPGVSGYAGGAASTIINIAINGMYKTPEQIKNECLKEISSEVV